MHNKNQRKFKQTKSQYSVQSCHRKQIEKLQKKIKGQNRINDDYDKRISQLDQQIKRQKSRLLCEYELDNENSLQFDHLLSTLIKDEKQINQKNKQWQEQLKIIDTHLRNKNQQIRKVEFQKQQYKKDGIDKLNEEQLHQVLQTTKAKMQRLDDEIMYNEPLKYQQDLQQAVNELNKQLQIKSKQMAFHKQDCEIRELQQTVLKGSLVVELAKFEQLKRQTQEKQQTLKSLNRHIEQIRERVIGMKKQRKILKKSTTTNTQQIKKQISQLDKQNQRLASVIFTTQAKINEQEEHIAKLMSLRKQKQLQQQLNYLQNKYEIIKNTFSKEQKIKEAKKSIKTQNSRNQNVKNKKKVKKLQNIQQRIKMIKQERQNYEKQIKQKRAEIERYSQQFERKHREENQKKFMKQESTNTEQVAQVKKNGQAMKIGSINIKMKYAYAFAITYSLALFLIYLWMSY